MGRQLVGMENGGTSKSRVTDRVVIVTGGSGGLGRAICRHAAAESYKVCVHYRSRPDMANSVVEEIRSGGGEAIAVAGDLTNETDVLELFAKTDAGLGKTTHLVNNAGILGWQGRVDETEANALNDLWAANITSAYLCSREAVRRMSTRHGGKGGVIVNMSSIAGRRGGRGERVHYATSKGALNAFTVGLAKEVADEGIRVNAVLPGFILTEFHDPYGGGDRAAAIAPSMPMKRVGAPEEVADVVLWLMSERSSFVTSTLVDVAGGS
jgi:NAD(P)-dependent dehydrogenase (short-subunit alcohol dehydrogenase family)